MNIVPYQESLEPAVDRFNERLAAGGKSEFSFPESHRDVENNPFVRRNYYLAVDDGGEVRGGYIIRTQPFSIGGKPFDHSFLKLPISEGVIDRRFAATGIQLLQDVLERSPSVYALGMGGIANPLPRLLQRMNWTVSEVPFFFKIRNAPAAIANLDVFRSGNWLSRFSKLASHTKLASIGLRAIQPPTRENRGVSVTVEKGFGNWANEIWNDSCSDYSMIAERTMNTLPTLYKPFGGKILVLRIRRDGKTIGWTTAMVTSMKNHKNFRNLRVATLVDGLAPRKDVPEVVSASIHHLESQNPDIIISNQLNSRWQEALRHCHFRNGPSNFAYALSPSTQQTLHSVSAAFTDIHINRGDGDGPIHL